MIHRIGFILLALSAITLGLVVGTLNSDPVSVDLLWVQIHWPLGLVILTSMVLGFAVGLLIMWLITVLPMRVQLRRLRGTSDQTRRGSFDGSDG